MSKTSKSSTSAQIIKLSRSFNTKDSLGSVVPFIEEQTSNSNKKSNKKSKKKWGIIKAVRYLTRRNKRTKN